MATHASRDTTSGLTFEKMAVIHRQDGVNISKKKLKTFLQERGVKDPTEYLSWMFEPDEAYYIPKTNEVVIYEKNEQIFSIAYDFCYLHSQYQRCYFRGC